MPALSAIGSQSPACMKQFSIDRQVENENRKVNETAETEARRWIHPARRHDSGGEVQLEPVDIAKDDRADGLHVTPDVTPDGTTSDFGGRQTFIPYSRIGSISK
jgi:hypothetical protein